MTTIPHPVAVAPVSRQRRAAGYLRVSTGKQVDHSISLKAQLREITDYAAAKGLQLSGIFRDEGRTGRNAKRTGLNELMKFALSAERPVDVVLIFSYSRFMRRVKILEEYIERLEDAGIKVEAVKQPLPDGPEGRLLRRQLASLDEYDSEIKGQNTLSCMMENARQGFWNGSTPPFGYEARVVEIRGDRQKKRLFPDPVTAPIVRRIYELYLHGDGSTGPLGCTALANLLNAEGVTYKRGARFTPKTVNEILNNEACIGTHHFNVTDSRSRKSKPPEVWIPLQIEPIVDAGVFAAAQQRLTERNPRKNLTHPRTAGSPLLLANLVVCRECGQTMVKASGKGYEYYSCRSKASRSGCSGHAVPRTDLDDLVVNAVHERAFASPRLPAIGQALAKALLDRTGDLRRELDGERGHLKSLDQRMDKLLDAGLADVFVSAMEQLKRKVDRLAAQRSEAEQRVARLERLMAPARKRIPKSRLLEFARAFRTAIASAPAAAARAWIAVHVEKVLINGERVEIVWR